MQPLSLVSLNIEGANHLDLVLPFLKQSGADVVCLQELFEGDIPAIQEALGRTAHVFLPNRWKKEGHVDIDGIAVFSKFHVERTASHYYHYSFDQNALFDNTNVDTKRRTENLGLTLADVRKGEACFRIMTTHFTWTPDGSADAYQRQDMNVFLEILRNCGEFVLCGDFNAPRIYKGVPGEIFSMLSSRYKDNIPAQYLTSLDVERHREGKNKPQELADKMVDGLFTTPRYRAKNVRLQDGLSDHMAILAEISVAEEAPAA